MTAELDLVAAAPPAEIAVAGQWKLFWLKFRRHRLAVASLVVVILLYLTAAFAPFLAPFDPNKTNATFTCEGIDISSSTTQGLL